LAGLPLSQFAVADQAAADRFDVGFAVEAGSNIGELCSRDQLALRQHIEEGVAVSDLL